MTGVAIVTGAGSGIGRALCLELASTGWRVICVGRRTRHLDATLAEIAPESSATAFEADVTQPDHVDALFDFAGREAGRVDLVVNNAGVHGVWNDLDDVSLDDWNEVVSVNLTGAFLMCRAAIRLMKSQVPGGGRIINNGSVSAQWPRRASGPYTASKHGLSGLTKAVALEGRDYGIACGQVDFGNVATEMTMAFGEGGVPQADRSRSQEDTFGVEWAARYLAFIAGLPLTVNVLSSTVHATSMPLIGRG